MLLGQSHRRVEADNREIARHMQNGLNDRFAHFGFEVIELGCVVPREGCAIIAMIDITDIASLMVAAFEDDCRIGLIVIMIFEINAHTRIIGKIFGVE